MRKKNDVKQALRFQLLLLISLTLPTISFALEKASPAPTFELQGVDGTVKLSGYQGKFVYVDFWASWCGPCKKSFPWMNEMQTKFGSQGLQIIGINLDNKNEDAQRFLANTKANFLIAFDPKGTMPGRYGVKGMPTSLLIGPDGKIIFEHVGFHESDMSEIENKIKLALKEK